MLSPKKLHSFVVIQILQFNLFVSVSITGVSCNATGSGPSFWPLVPAPWVPILILGEQWAVGSDLPKVTPK